MKRIIYSCFLLIALLFCKPIAAQFNFTLVPSAALCYTGAGAYTVVAVQTASSPALNGGGSYGWGVIPSLGVTFTVASGTGTSAVFTFTDCGTYTITHAAYLPPPNNLAPVDLTQKTFTLFCPQGASVSATPSNVCAGSQANLSVSGAVTATWTTGPTNSITTVGTGININVTPSVTTIYSVTAVTAAGCIQTGTISQKPL